MIVETCWACIVSLHEECFEVKPVEDAEDWLWFTCCCKERGQEAVAWVDDPRTGVAPPEDVTDVLSTGRKRAAMVAVIYPGQVCEWAWLRSAGGGVGGGIIGCTGNRIADVKKNTDVPANADMRGERHHGPDKNVLNNSVGVNLHRICAECHKRWHAVMDRYYEGERPSTEESWLPVAPTGSGMSMKAHDPKTRATAEELEFSEAWWSLRAEKRGDYPFLQLDEPESV